MHIKVTSNKGKVDYHDQSNIFISEKLQKLNNYRTVQLNSKGGNLKPPDYATLRNREQNLIRKVTTRYSPYVGTGS